MAAGTYAPEHPVSAMPRTASDRPQRKAVARPAAARTDVEQNVLRKFRVVFSSAKKHFRAIEERCGVSGAQLWALIEIHNAPGARISEVAQRMAIHPSTTSNLLDKVEAQGLVRRVRDDADQRVVRLHLTDQGRRVVARAPAPARGVVPDALGRLSRSSLEALDRSLEELLRELLVLDRGADDKPLSDI